MRCRACGSEWARSALSLGRVPLANEFVSDGSKTQDTFELGVQFCPDCAIVQMTELVDPARLFSNYIYTPSASATWRAHCADLAGMISRLPGMSRESFIVEVASNDGCLLQELAGVSDDVLGVEPAANLAGDANRRGLRTDCSFFGRDTAERLCKEHRPAQVIVGTNVLGHATDLDDFLGGIATLLGPDGSVVFEVPYLEDLISSSAIDTIYHEHVSYFSASSLQIAFLRAGLGLRSIDRISLHGGSLRVVAGRGVTNGDGTVAALIDAEERSGLRDGSRLDVLVDLVPRMKTAFVELVRSFGGSVVGYGATAKGNTLNSIFGLTSEDIIAIADKNPLKQGLLTPGAHIPVVPPEELRRLKPAAIVVFAWNLVDEILAGLADLTSTGTAIIVPIPWPHVVESPPLKAAREKR